MEKSNRLVAVVYPQAGGFMARILPPGIVCFSESLDGLQREIQTALEKYTEDLDEMADAAAEPPVSKTQADWEDTVDAATVFLWDLDEMFRH